MVLSLICCGSLAVWTNSTPSSTMTTTPTSTWWRTWAAWTGWARVSWRPASVHSGKGAGLCAPIESQSTKSPSLCAGKGTTSTNIVIRKLETVDPLSLPPQFLADFDPPFTAVLPLCSGVFPLFSSERKPVIVLIKVFRGSNCSQTNQSRTAELESSMSFFVLHYVILFINLSLIKRSSTLQYVMSRNSQLELTHIFPAGIMKARGW